MSLEQAMPEDNHVAPMWWVSNGKSTIGPVSTNLLLRGVSAGRVPDECWVLERRWAEWRPLGQVREVKALRALEANPEAVGLELDGGLKLIESAMDREEVLLLALHAGIASTSAESGLVHRVDASGVRTMCTHGAKTLSQLGQAMSGDDPALATARSGSVWLGTAQDPDAQSIVVRLGTPGLVAVAVVPVVVQAELIAFMELGRSDHAFRFSDVPRLRRVADAAARAWLR